ncbi:facilitated trehalose transporter Tret1-like [Microplitis demolitor]|uniref:facilitated trehalose transporter Tret1-like n=1 Tax=Microplitis demolitor TaxID=69319 RepID=UPI0004CDD7F0|nr:facilitated trehalose transporter Tret1-like [Microplitis demolitor]
MVISSSICCASLSKLFNNSDSKIKENFKYYLRQCLVSLIPIISTIATGMTMGYSAILLPQLQSINGSSGAVGFNGSLTRNSVSLTITSTNEESWIAASSILAMAPGCWVSSILMDKFGRKMTFILINPIFTLGWTIVGVTTKLMPLIFGRLLCGFGAGLLSATSPVYIAEISDPHLRGILLASLSCAVTFGILVTHILGTWLHWQLTAHLCSIISILCFALSYFMPESPNWLLQNGNHQSAFEVWYFLRGNTSSEEFESNCRSRNDNNNNNNNNNTNNNSNNARGNSISAWYDKYLTRLFFSPLVIVCVFAFTSQFSGINVVAFYCVTLLTEVSGPENAYLATLVLDVARVACSIVACWMISMYPRRLLTSISGFGTAMTLFALSACLLADYGKPWLPIVLLFIYTCTVTIGLVPLPWLLCGELFTDTTTRAFGSALSSSFAFFCFFVAVKTGPIVMDVLLSQDTFAIYGLIALLGTVILYVWLPETKDKTLEDIKSVFVKKTNNENLTETTRC